MPEATTDTATGTLRVTVGSLPLVLDWDGHGFRVRNKQGDLLDPDAAEVLVSLGGDPPRWLAVVDGLHAVYQHHGPNGSNLSVAAYALSRSHVHVGHIAKTDTDSVVLTALAAAGHAQVAANPACTSIAWDLLAAARDRSVSDRAWAQAHTLPPQLAEHRDPEVRIRVARNPVCRDQILARLAHDEDVRVRLAIAGNPRTPPETLDFLAATGDERLLLAAATHPATPIRSLKRLSHQRQPRVRAAVAANHAYPSGLATRLMWDAHGSIRTSLAARPDLSPLALSWIERYARRDRKLYRQTLWRLANNPTSPERLLKRVQLAQQRIATPLPTTKFRGWLIFGATGFLSALVITVILVIEAATEMYRLHAVTGVVLLTFAVPSAWLARLSALVVHRKGWKRHTSARK